MLKRPDDLPRACREFQRHYEGGRRDDHLAECTDCRRFVEFVDGLRQLGLHQPLENDLRSRLRGLSGSELGAPAAPRVPELPLPVALRQRLRAIARAGAAELPIWIRSPRYAIAASYLLTLLIGGTLGNPAAWAKEAGGRLETVESAWHDVRATGRETWADVGATAAENLNLTHEHLRAAATSLRARWAELVESMNEPETTDEEADGGADAATAS